MIAGGGSGYVDHSIQSLMVGDTVQVIFDQKNSKYIYRVAVNNNEVMTSRPGDNAQGSTSRFNNFYWSYFLHNQLSVASRVGQDTQEEHVVERWLEDQVVLMDVTLLMMTVCVVRVRLRSS